MRVHFLMEGTYCSLGNNEKISKIDTDRSDLFLTISGEIETQGAINVWVL